jgi:Tfp pilus assembly protein PilF
MREDRWDEAARELRAASELDPAPARAHYDLGVFLLHQRRETEALQEFHRALAADLKFDAARKATGRSLPTPQAARPRVRARPR